MQKPWITSRVFIASNIFSILLVNIFMYLLYFLIINNIITNTYNSITNEYSTIKSFIDLQKTNIFILPKYEIEKLNSNEFYFYIWNNDITLQKKYKIGLIENKNEIIFRWDYKWFNIIIWKKLYELKNIKNSFIKIALILNIFLILWSLIISYFITKYSLRPLINLSNFLNYYNKNNTQKLLKNKYWDSEIWILTKSINNFIKQNNEILNKQKSFIQDTSHELKTPLMQINSNIELIEDKIKDKKIKNKILEIKKSSENIWEIISNLNFILRWEEKLQIKNKINLFNYFEKFIKKYESISKEKNIKIIIIKNTNLTIENNTYYLDRLFWNIIENAIYYNNWNNKLKIIINKNSIEIIDEWIWIKKEELNKIFNRFYRNSNSWIFNQNWNWLGLSIIKKICDMFGWKIKIESNVDKWTKFIIKIKD